MTAVYDSASVRFLYPENWELVDEPSDDLPKEISVQSPTGGFWSLHVFDDQAEPGELLEQVLLSMRAEYDELEAELVSERIGPVESRGYDLEFYCLDFVATARVRLFQRDAHTFVVLAQAESRDFEALKDVFRAITLSLLAGGAVHASEV